MSGRSRKIWALKTKYLSHRCYQSLTCANPDWGATPFFRTCGHLRAMRNPLSSRNSNQMHVQPTSHLFLALFTAKIYQLLMADSSQLVTCCALSCRRLHNFLHAKQALICGPNMRHSRVQSRNRVPVMIATRPQFLRTHIERCPKIGCREVEPVRHDAGGRCRTPRSR